MNKILAKVVQEHSRWKVVGGKRKTEDRKPKTVGTRADYSGKSEAGG